MNAIKQDVKEALLASPAAAQWQHISIADHHGIAVPLFSLHTKNSCGIGEYPDLIPLITWCREVGFDIIQLLPLNDTGLETSPYSAISANALNPIHIGLSSLPYLEPNTNLTRQLSELQALTHQTQRIEYPKIQTKRETFLRSYYQQYRSLISAQENYQAFKTEQSYWLQDFAVFKSLKIFQNWLNWENWPPVFQNPNANFSQHFPSDILSEAEYHIFLQFLCFQQLEAVKKHAEHENVKLKGDIPILINRESADVWRYPEQFSLEFSAGAPPDMYSWEGQKWGFPLYRWDVLAANQYKWWIERLRTASCFYHLYRIDHIVGFFRIWGVPLDLPPKLGHFIPMDEKTWIPHGETILGVMLDNCGMLPIGEDLGTVPPEVRECLRKLGICGTKVMRWERYWHGDQSFIDPSNYPPESMTTVSTHDSDTLQLWWRNNPEESEVYAKSVGWEYSSELTPSQHFAILSSSHSSGSLFHINLLQEYLALIPKMTWPNIEDERINVPGVISDRNWSYRFLPSVEEIVGNKELKQIIQKMTHI
ncbi:MAG TPA: 4-alpha-glucanotransferase [Parachlamydiaceae bacterium]|nr:4-alpha-glucanotransferase [Parachlamydiaceae bacterium]